jgi:hypothetical protein
VIHFMGDSFLPAARTTAATIHLAFDLKSTLNATLKIGEDGTRVDERRKGAPSYPPV